MRATVRSAFFLLEGYLNALSWDIQKLKGSALTKDEKIWLSEWDEQTERQRTLGLRDKLHKYPKIAIGKQYPPLLETNCPELKFIVESEEELRHSLVHPKVETHIEVERQLAPRESRLYMLEHGSCERLMDSAISLIRKIGEVVGDRYGDVNIWLHDRNSEGGFSAGLRHALALDSTGTIYAWGNNTWGQCGQDPDIYPTVNAPMPIVNLLGINCSKISAGYFHNLAIKDDGSLWAWGTTHSGALGIPLPIQNSYEFQLQEISPGITWREIAGGWTRQGRWQGSAVRI